MKSFAATLAVTTLLAPGVLGHGYVQQLRINDNEYVNTWNPYKDPQKNVVRITRKFYDNGPIPDGMFVTDAITCNGDNIPVNLTHPIAAGSKVEFLWTPWESDHPGPIMTYLAKCPNGCANFKGNTGKVWVQIAAEGYNPNEAIPWASKRLPTLNSTWPAVIPKILANGEYLLRHEILGLQRGTEAGRSQFYPSCNQITVTNGGGVELPEGIALPGGYPEDHPSILLQYRDISATKPYTPPGGPVWPGGSQPTSYTLPTATPTSTTKPATSSTTRSTTSTTKSTTTTTKSTTTTSKTTSTKTSTTTTKSTTTSPASTPTSGTVAQFGQCGGSGYTGPTVCVSPFTCTFSNEWYSQCL